MRTHTHTRGRASIVYLYLNEVMSLQAIQINCDYRGDVFAYNECDNYQRIETVEVSLNMQDCTRRGLPLSSRVCHYYSRYWRFSACQIFSYSTYCNLEVTADDLFWVKWSLCRSNRCSVWLCLTCSNSSKEHGVLNIFCIIQPGIRNCRSNLQCHRESFVINLILWIKLMLRTISECPFFRIRTEIDNDQWTTRFINTL